MNENIKIYLSIDDKLDYTDSDAHFTALLLYKTHSKSIEKKYNGINTSKCALLSFINTMSYIKRYDIPIILYTNNAYLINVCSKWINVWSLNNWVLDNGKELIHKNMIISIYEILKKIDISFRYINPKKSNYIKRTIDSYY